jgi:hypothetical protein
MLMSEYSFVDRDMFMRYLGGGIGHIAVATQPEEENIEEDIITTNDPKAMAEVQASDRDEHLLEKLRQAASIMAGGGTANDREEVEQVPDSDSDDHDTDADSDDEGMDDSLSTDGDHEGENYLGPEDGEDEGYLDSGYGAL